jgi:predicted DNA-binding transcriptional regulator AlpA
VESDDPKGGAAQAGKFTDAQKAFILKQGAEGEPVAEVCRRAGISQATYLKLGRKAIWERTRNPKIGFPKPTHFGSCRHRWRAGEVRAWAEGSVTT